MAARPRKLSVVVREGDHKASLIAMRDRLAAAMDTCAARELTPLSRQLHAVLAELRALDAGNEPKEPDGADEIARKRSERRRGKGSAASTAAERSAGQ